MDAISLTNDYSGICNRCKRNPVDDVRMVTGTPVPRKRCQACRTYSAMQQRKTTQLRLGAAACITCGTQDFKTEAGAVRCVRCASEHNRRL